MTAMGMGNPTPCETGFDDADREPEWTDEDWERFDRVFAFNRYEVLTHPDGRIKFGSFR